MTFHAELLIRGPGMDDEATVAAGSSYWSDGWNQKELLGPLPPLPEFSESIETIGERIAKVVGHVTVPHKINSWNPAIGRLLKEDEERREKQLRDLYPSVGQTIVRQPLERRRLRLLNSLFFAATKVNGKPNLYGREYGGENRDILLNATRDDDGKAQN